MERGTLIWRSLSAKDVPALARAHAAVEAVDETGEHLSEQDVRDMLEDGSLDLGRDTLAAFTPDGEVVAFVRVYGSGEVGDVDRVNVDGAVVPSARAGGFGRRLLEWGEERAAGLHRERQPQTPARVCVVVHDGNPGKEALVRAAGYEPNRFEHEMVRPLDDPLPELPPAPAGLTVAAYESARDEEVRQAHREAFAEHEGATAPDERAWSQRYTGLRAFRPDVSWLVLDGDEVAGYLLSYFWEADAAASGVREAFVGQLGVRRPWRRRGLGGLLLATALHSYRDARYRRSALTVDPGDARGALRLYERAGYVVRGTWVTWMKPLA